jgi:cardiolipin synthase A/B
METSLVRTYIPGFIAGMLVLLVSCSGVTSTARREQANDSITGGGNLAMTAFRATAVAAARRPVTTARLGLSILWHRPRAVVSGNSPVELTRQTTIAEAPGSPEFETLLDRLNFPPAEAGTLRWLVDGEGFFPELDRQIASARDTIRFQIYIFDNDDIGVRYADALKRRAGEIEVRVVFDDLGTTFAHTAAPDTLGPRGFIPPPDMHAYLRNHSKIRVRRSLNPWLVSDHTKLLVFDQRSAIIGGMNIGREYYSDWHDLMVRVDGPIVGSLSREFDRSWANADPWGDFAWSEKARTLPLSRPVAGQVPLRLLRTDLAEGYREILDASLLAIRGARRRIWIQNPYFAHDEIALALMAAARRGVDVRVIIPSGGDSAIMAAGNLSTARGLIGAGGKVFQYPRMTHLKAMICDDWANFGSANLDTLSMCINRELNLAFSHRGTVEALENAVFLPDFRRSRRISLAETRSIANDFAEAIADQL